MTSDFEAQIQVDSVHYTQEYDDIRRWSSYWWQLRLVEELGNPSPFIEIGIGNNVVGRYLKDVRSMNVTGVDLDPELHPDLVASIESIPVDTDSFACAMACQVLEHLPYENAEFALSELRRIASTAIVSVPNASHFVFDLEIGFGSRKRSIVKMDLNRFFPKPEPLAAGGQHYWELGRGETSVRRFRASLESCGWKLQRDFRNPDFPYHHFFVLKRSDGR